MKIQYYGAIHSQSSFAKVYISRVEICFNQYMVLEGMIQLYSSSLNISEAQSYGLLLFAQVTGSPTDKHHDTKILIGTRLWYRWLFDLPD